VCLPFEDHHKSKKGVEPIYRGLESLVHFARSVGWQALRAQCLRTESFFSRLKLHPHGVGVCLSSIAMQ
jgi:hypothetical protein